MENAFSQQFVRDFAAALRRNGSRSIVESVISELVIEPLASNGHMRHIII
jgi:hypothetical protein